MKWFDKSSKENKAIVCAIITIAILLGDMFRIELLTHVLVHPMSILLIVDYITLIWGKNIAKAIKKHIRLY